MNKRSSGGTEAYRSFFETGFGVGVVAASDNGLLEIILPFGGETPDKLDRQLSARYARIIGESPLTRRAAELLARYFAGERVAVDLPVDQSGFTAFQRKVYRAVMEIPYGEVASYGSVAARIGQPQAARGIGGAMAHNPLPIIIPCHRVVGSGGGLTGYSASGGIASKRWLLDMEREGRGK